MTLHTEFEDLLRAYRALARGQQVTCPKAWLYRIATNVANDHFRRARLLRLTRYLAIRAVHGVIEVRQQTLADRLRGGDHSRAIF